jgi:hypothetical protein
MLIDDDEEASATTTAMLHDGVPIIDEAPPL